MGAVTTTWVVVVVLLAVLVGVYLSWTAGRLDRMHARVDAAWAALDAQLVRRAAAASTLALQLPPELGARLRRAATASLGASSQRDREAVENDLSSALRAAVAAAPADAELEELKTAATRVGLARAFHNTAVKDTLVLRRRLLPRLFHLAGHRPVPSFFEIDDALDPPAAPAPPVPTPGSGTGTGPATARGAGAVLPGEDRA